MNDRTINMMREFVPQLAIMVYESGDRNYYLESHNIDKKGQILEGKPLQQDTIQEIVDVFFDEQQNRSKIEGLIPENLLCYSPLPGGNYKMIWYRPAEVRFLHFSEALHLKSGKAWVPALLYVVNRKAFNVYALPGDERPSETTKLLRAPFHNVSDSGSVCLGTAQVKKPTDKTFSSTMKYWEDLFWLSEFSHLNGAGNPTKTNVNMLWKNLVEGKAKVKWSELDELRQLKNTTLKTIL